MRLFISAATIVLSTQMSWAQSASSWTGSYGFSSPTEMLARTSQADLIKRAEEGWYETFGADQYNIDQSVGDVYIGDGAEAEIDIRTGDNSGNNSNSIGSQNNSYNDINIDGDGNDVDINNSADNDGCQDGSINIGSSSGFDITGGSSTGSGMRC